MFLVLGGRSVEANGGGDAANRGAEEGRGVSAASRFIAAAEAGRLVVPSENDTVGPASGGVGKAKLALGKDGAGLSRPAGFPLSSPATAD